MNYRSLGRTGLVVSEIGFGAWGIGGRPVSQTSYGDTDDRTSLAALAQARDCGITFFDTSAAYGNGHSEELIGEALAGGRPKAPRAPPRARAGARTAAASRWPAAATRRCWRPRQATRRGTDRRTSRRRRSL